jgi:acyl-CoA reductase-like NAD-dependent aldehyde dehydrogenase
LRTPIRHQLFIDGKFVDAESGETIASLNPHDNSKIADVALAGKADVDKAVGRGEARLSRLERMAAADRGRILLRLADLIEVMPRTGPARIADTGTRCATRASSTCRARRRAFATSADGRQVSG